MEQGNDLARMVGDLGRARVLVIGDVMIDRYVFGSVDRVSPEAPVPVLRHARREARLGGAANVLRNLAALGARARLASVVGNDGEGRELAQLVEDAGADAADLVAETGRTTTVKDRFVAGGQQLLRVDRETTAPPTEDGARRLLRNVADAARDVDVIVLSDYRKGVLCPDVLRGVLAIAAETGCPVLVDPKGRDYAIYAGAFLVKPNARELEEATGLPAGSDDEVVRACRDLLDRYELGAVLATRGPQGMTLVLRDQPEAHLRARASEVYDVSGAGDTVIATLAAALGSGLPPAQAAFLANVAAGVVVRKLGTAVAYPEEITAALHDGGLLPANAKLVRVSELQPTLDACRRAGKRIGFTNGCFDLLHPGHVSLLRQAKAACDFLVVGLNGDASVRRLKGPLRPVQDQTARAAVLASLGMVDRIVVFDEDTPAELIEAVRPDVLVKGADYTVESVVGASFVQSYGGRVLLADLAAGFSTTSTIARINANPEAAE